MDENGEDSDFFKEQFKRTETLVNDAKKGVSSQQSEESNSLVKKRSVSLASSPPSHEDLPSSIQTREQLSPRVNRSISQSHSSSKLSSVCGGDKISPREAQLQQQKSPRSGYASPVKRTPSIPRTIPLKSLSLNTPPSPVIESNTVQQQQQQQLGESSPRSSSSHHHHHQNKPVTTFTPTHRSGPRNTESPDMEELREQLLYNDIQQRQKTLPPVEGYNGHLVIPSEYVSACYGIGGGVSSTNSSRISTPGGGNTPRTEDSMNTHLRYIYSVLKAYERNFTIHDKRLIEYTQKFTQYETQFTKLDEIHRLITSSETNAKEIFIKKMEEGFLLKLRETVTRKFLTQNSDEILNDITIAMREALVKQMSTDSDAFFDNIFDDEFRDTLVKYKKKKKMTEEADGLETRRLSKPGPDIGLAETKTSCCTCFSFITWLFSEEENDATDDDEEEEELSSFNTNGRIQSTYNRV